MKIDLEISYVEGTVKAVSAVAPDLVAFETHFEKSIARLSEPMFTHLAFLAWSVEKRTKATSLEFMKWVETIDFVKVVAEKK